MLARLGLVVATLAVVVASGYLLTSHVEPFSIEQLLPETHPTRVSYEQYRQHYNDERYSYLLVSREDRPFTPAELKTIDQILVRRLEQVQHLEAVDSMGTAQRLTRAADGFRFVELLTSGRLPNDDLWAPEFMGAAKQAFVVRLDFGKDLAQGTEFAAFQGLFAVVDKIGLPPPIETHVFGTKVARHHMVREMVRNQTVILPLVIGLMALVIYLLFRSFVVILLSLYAVMMSYLIVLSLIVWNEGHIDPYSSYALFLILIVGTADLVHFFSAWREAGDRAWPEQLRHIREKVQFPCLLTTATTMICFLTLLFNNSPPVKSFGLYCALGTGVCFLITFYVLPTLIRYTIGARQLPEPKWVEKIQPPRFLFTHRRLLQAGAVAIVLVSAVGASRLKIEDNFYEKFTSRHEFTRATDAFTKHFGFLGTIDVLLRAPAWTTPTGKQALRNVVQALQQLPNVYGTRSFLNFLDNIDAVLGPPGPQYEEELASLLTLYGTLGLTDGYYRAGGQEVRIVVRLNSYQTTDVENTIGAIHQLLKELPSGVTGEINGFSPLRSEITSSVTHDFLQSFGASFVLLAGLFFLLFRKVKVTVLAMIPNLFPLIVLGGILGWIQFGIEDSMVLIVCVVFGIAVDDTIHFLWVLKKHQGDAPTATSEQIRTTYREVGPALTATTAIFFVALPAFLLMEMTLFIQVGSLMVLGLTLALLCDLLLLPTLLVSKNERLTPRSS